MVLLSSAKYPRPLDKPTGAILCLHPLPTAGGMMDSHLFKKAANRLQHWQEFLLCDLTPAEQPQ